MHYEYTAEHVEAQENEEFITHEVITTSELLGEEYGIERETKRRKTKLTRDNFPILFYGVYDTFPSL